MMSSDTNKRPKEKAVSTNQALKQKLERSEAEAKTIVEAKPDSEKIQTTAFVKKSVLKKPKRPSAFKGHGRLMGLYVYSLLKKFCDCKLEILTINDAINHAIGGGDGTLEADEYGISTRTIARVCDDLSDLFGEPIERSIIEKLVKDECGGVIKKEVSKGRNLYYFSDPQSPRHDYVNNKNDAKDKVSKEFVRIENYLYDN